MDRVEAYPVTIAPRFLWLGLTTAFLAAAALGLGSSATAVATAKVIDRTFGCTPGALEGIVRATDLDAIPIGQIDQNNPFHVSPGFIGVTSGGWEPSSELVSIRARGWQRFASTYSAAGVLRQQQAVRLVTHACPAHRDRAIWATRPVGRTSYLPGTRARPHPSSRHPGLRRCMAASERAIRRSPKQDHHRRTGDPQ